MSCPTCHRPDCGCPASPPLTAGHAAPSPWPFHELAAQRHAATMRLQGDLAAWRRGVERQIEPLLTKTEMGRVNVMLDRVLAVRA